MLESIIKCCLFLYLKLCFVAFKITYESNIYIYKRKTSTYLVISPCDINKQAEEGGHEKECE